MINPIAHASAILDWMENEIGTVSRDELRARIEQEVRDVARRAYDDGLDDARGIVDAVYGPLYHMDTSLEIARRISDLRHMRPLKAGL